VRRRKESTSNPEELTDTQIYAAIRYLDRNGEDAKGLDVQNNSATSVLVASILILVLGAIVLGCAYQWAR
jgi:hypothetical protein